MHIEQYLNHTDTLSIDWNSIYFSECTVHQIGRHEQGSKHPAQIRQCPMRLHCIDIEIRMEEPRKCKNGHRDGGDLVVGIDVQAAPRQNQ